MARWKIIFNLISAVAVSWVAHASREIDIARRRMRDEM
jgi:hypothetical protein